jgi:hypothetical protein
MCWTDSSASRIDRPQSEFCRTYGPTRISDVSTGVSLADTAKRRPDQVPKGPRPATDEFTDLGATECHAQCYITCSACGAFAPDDRR